jgi:sialic acid synthase SpsE
VPAYKIGSGDITWLEQIEHIARKGKPVLLATGASTADEVERAVAAVLAHTGDLVLMQCNTNYTGSRENFRCVQLNVLGTFAHMYPGLLLGFSDHTPGHSAVLGAVALGARVIEKHFTDDTRRKGPDHGFAMDPVTWREMVDRTRELELALGDGVKRIEANERETVIVQRRSLRTARELPRGTLLERAHLCALRPCPADAIAPDRLADVLGKRLRTTLPSGSALRWIDLE